MLPRYCVFVIILTKLGCLGAQWQILEDFKQTIRKYSRTGDEVIKGIDDFIAKKKYETLDFLYNIDHTPYLERSELRPYCTQVHQRLEELVYLFKLDIVKLETPLVNIRLEIKDRLSDIISSIDIYQKLADNRYQNCRQGNYVCEDQIVHWLRDKIDKINCRVTANCVEEKNKTLVKRSVSDCEEYQCRNGQCIEYEYVCNGNNDCSDGSEETPGCSRYCFDGFHCRDLRCINKMMVCDGLPDCEDGSDEEDCKPQEILYSAANCSFEDGNFLCSNRHCVGLREVCNGKDDCGDSSDEGPACEEEARCAAGCTASGGVCVPGPKETLCLNECPFGMVDDNGTCHPGPQKALASMEGLLEQVPYMLERFVGSVGLLKRGLIGNLEQAFLNCLGPPTRMRSLAHFNRVFQTSQ